MDENKKRCAIGVDFGGTFVKMARVDEHGAIGARASFATTDLQGVPGWLDEVERHVGADGDRVNSIHTEYSIGGLSR